MDSRFARVKQLLVEVADLSEPERQAYLDHACKDDPELRHEIECILAHEGKWETLKIGDSHTSTARPPSTAADADPAHPSAAAHSTAPPVPTGRPPVPLFRPGDVVARRYRIESYLAAGGMGQVYRVFDQDLQATLALKTIRPEVAANPAALRRFKQEVLLARSVTHPTVCRIFDLGRDDASSCSFLTMELLSGDTLAARIRENGALMLEESLPLVCQMADGLDAAHFAGVVHRDFKSSNVMLVPTDGVDRVVITDFGLATAFPRRTGPIPERLGSEVQMLEVDSLHAARSDDSGVATGLGVQRLSDEADRKILSIQGTPAYMSPEQVTGGRVGPASDLYSLGVVLFEMSTGRLPFRESTPIDMALAHVYAKPPKPSAVADVSDVWEKTILRLLEKEPSKRYATAHQVVLALQGRANGKEVVRHSLPAERDAFVGRTAELETLAEQLERANGSARTRLLTLQGPGGTGKTRLARKYGWVSLARWPGGVWFCDLSDARNLEEIARAVSKVLDVPLGKDDPISPLGNAIAGLGECLVILDNFEQVVEHADATLGRWLERTTEARFLVTTRERLGLPEEATCFVEPLDPTTQGVELFEVRGQSHRPGFVVDDTNRPQVEDIVRRLDGFPLAIELASARLRVLSVEQLGQRLVDRFRILAGGKPSRHETLAAALDWSWNLLEPWEQSAIAQASVFEGGFSLEAAEAVIELDAHDEVPFVLDVIQSLIDKSWLQTRAVLDAPRFSMYATVQEYASKRLCAREGDGAGTSGELASRRAAEARHGAYFAAMGSEEAVANLERHGGVELRGKLNLELDNLVAACHRAVAGRQDEVAVATYAASSAVFGYRGPLSSAVRLGREVLGILRDRKQLGRALPSVALVEQLAGAVEEAREHLEAALAIHRELGNRTSEGSVLNNLAILHREQGRVEEAREHFEAALAIHREVGNRIGEGRLLMNLGNLHWVQGRMEKAREHHEAALAIYREVGDRLNEGGALSNLGNLHWGQGRIHEARESYEAALVIHREVGNRHFEGNTLGNLGVLHREQGRMEEARKCHEVALTIFRELGKRSAEAAELGNLGILNMEQNRLEEAHENYDAALAIHHEVGDRFGEGIVLGNLGNLHMEQGRMEEAHENYEAALAIHREVGDRASEGIVLGSLGNLHMVQNRLEEARICLTQGVRVLRDLGQNLALGKTLCLLADYELRHGDVASALGVLAEAESIADNLAVTAHSPLACHIEELRQALAQQTD